jgi:hypothetical protein
VEVAFGRHGPHTLSTLRRLPVRSMGAAHEVPNSVAFPCVATCALSRLVSTIRDKLPPSLVFGVGRPT